MWSIVNAQRRIVRDRQFKPHQHYDHVLYFILHKRISVLHVGCCKTLSSLLFGFGRFIPFRTCRRAIVGLRSHHRPLRLTTRSSMCARSRRAHISQRALRIVFRMPMLVLTAFSDDDDNDTANDGVARILFIPACQ